MIATASIVAVLAASAALSDIKVLACDPDQLPESHAQTLLAVCPWSETAENDGEPQYAGGVSRQVVVQRFRVFLYVPNQNRRGRVLAQLEGIRQKIDNALLGHDFEGAVSQCLFVSSSRVDMPQEKWPNILWYAEYGMKVFNDRTEAA